ncbi:MULTISPECIES: MadS family sensor histidine kinase [unclassified Nocardioides]|uniref:MadS family sensor histidine kinase n=1 Tax=unclassified Nocardioides TaxID=2615069 RepID=UPI000703158D|nr:MULTISPECIES: histidine kinase [unclassified Nocardioides]KQZ75455.1 histidine kinase [Nocardioides sp. Root151]KRF14530.1 histidine kinase [Nocardioides sp. Soil796]
MSDRHTPTGSDLTTLTGVRSGKGSYYRAYVRSDERMQHAVRAMDSISRALVRTAEGPRALLEEVARAAAQHLDAQWTVLALSDGQLPGARPRFLAVDHVGRVIDDDADLPHHVRRELGAIRAGHATGAPGFDRWVRVPMTLDNAMIGSLVGLHGLDAEPEPGDLSVLRILANEAAVSLYNCEQYQAGLALHRRAQRLYDDAVSQALDLEERTRELRQAEERLLVAHQRELVDHERHRIARELHDNVTQFVLSAGMSMEIARGEAEDLGASAAGLLGHLSTAKNLTQEAVDQLRRAIYALHQPHRDTVWTLPELLQEVAEHHRPHLSVHLHIEGEVQVLPADADHEIARAVGEALFNVAVHAEATRAVIRMRYRTDELFVSVADDGVGDPGELARKLRIGRGRPADGRHCGLANIYSRLSDIGGSLAFRRARIGGVRIEMRVPLPLAVNRPGMITGLVGARPEEEACPP